VSDIKWFDILNPPLRGGNSHHVLAALHNSQDALAIAYAQLREVSAEAEVSRRVLASVIQQAGGEVVITDTELARISFAAAIHSEHNSDTRSTRIWIERTP
jgi:hypothetical protein